MKLHMIAICEALKTTYEVDDLNSGHDQSMLLLRNEVQGLQSSSASWQIRVDLFLPSLFQRGSSLGSSMSFYPDFILIFLDGHS